MKPDDINHQASVVIILAFPLNSPGYMLNLFGMLLNKHFTEYPSWIIIIFDASIEIS
jgi:hypothetical protein